MESREKMYIVYIIGGSNANHEKQMFVTSSEETATRWVEKFNSKIDYWRNACSKYDELGRCTWESNRAEDIRDTSHAYWDTIEVRN